MKYPVKLESDSDDTVMVSFPDLPGTLTYGEDEEDGLLRALDALESMVEALIAERRPVPMPGRRRGPSVQVPTQTALKILLHNRMLERGVTKAQLARALHLHRPQVDRMLSLRNASRLDQIDAAMAWLGADLSVRVEDRTHRHG